MRRGDALHPFQCLEAALCLTRLAGLGTEAIHIGLDVADLALLLLKGRLLVGQTLGTHAFEIGVIAGIEGNLLLLYMGDVVGDVVEKIPVMGD